uniref:Uncharacterized protein n=1 Tax=Eutreptiella gymnastica TaxID=73025 RepID=A0A7S1J7X0_9EUGL
MHKIYFFSVPFLNSSNSLNMSSIDMNFTFTSPHSSPFQSGTLIQYDTPFHSNPYYLDDTMDDYYYDDGEHEIFDQSPFTAEWTTTAMKRTMLRLSKPSLSTTSPTQSCVSPQASFTTQGKTIVGKKPSTPPSVIPIDAKSQQLFQSLLNNFKTTRKSTPTGTTHSVGTATPPEVPKAGSSPKILDNAMHGLVTPTDFMKFRPLCTPGDFSQPAPLVSPLSGTVPNAAIAARQSPPLHLLMEDMLQPTTQSTTPVAHQTPAEADHDECEEFAWAGIPGGMLVEEDVVEETREEFSWLTMRSSEDLEHWVAEDLAEEEAMTRQLLIQEEMHARVPEGYVIDFLHLVFHVRAGAM